MSDETVKRLAALTQVLTAVRYLHPSDQVANVDWSAYVPVAIERVRAATDQVSFEAALTGIVAELAPTARFGAPPVVLKDPRATHLARWNHLGLGSEKPYRSFREGLAKEPDVDVDVGVLPRLTRVATCGTATAQFSVRAGASSDKIDAFIIAVGREKFVQTPIASDGSATTVRLEVPSGTTTLQVGIEVNGRASAQLTGVKISCANGETTSVDVGKETWSVTDARDLFVTKQTRCNGKPCLEVSRPPFDTELVENRDVLAVDAGLGLRLYLPRAVWTDGTHTFPLEPVPKTPSAATTSPKATDPVDRATRLGAVAMAWGTLSLFYPYFHDQQIDWRVTFPAAMRDADAATSFAELQGVLARLVAKLHDDHARVSHPALELSGQLPISMRRFGKQVIVTGVLPPATSSIQVGDEITALDGISIDELYRRTREMTSAATPGWLEWAVPDRLTMSQRDTPRRLRVRTATGERDIELRPVPAEKMPWLVESHPTTGTEVSPGVVYVNAGSLELDRWKELLPRLATARAVIFDLRGYLTNVAFIVLGHFITETVTTPTMEIPLVRSLGPHEVDVRTWTVSPFQPHLTAKLVVLIDGETASSPETLLQMFRNAHVGMFVGEPSGGTNGNANTFQVPGGFTVRFTGMRVLTDGGVAIQGRGFQPDVVVHPTLAGVRAGRHEILDAAVAEAQR